jgi:hypothetical protein
MGDIVGSSDDLNQPLNDQELDLLQVTTLLYYLHESNPDNWLIRDKTDPNAPVSIAACGMSLATIPIVVERDVLFRDFAAKITRKRLRYLLELPQGPEPDASSYKRLFLSFPGHRIGSPSLAMRAFNHRLGVSVRRRFDSRHLLRS